jgi:hypothetical protein
VQKKIEESEITLQKFISVFITVSYFCGIVLFIYESFSDFGNFGIIFEILLIIPVCLMFSNFLGVLDRWIRKVDKVRHVDLDFGLCTLPGLCSRSIISAIANREEHIADSNIVVAIVELAWSFTRVFYTLELLLDLFFILMLVLFAQRVHSASSPSNEECQDGSTFGIKNAFFTGNFFLRCGGVVDLIVEMFKVFIILIIGYIVWSNALLVMSPERDIHQRSPKPPTLGIGRCKMALRYGCLSCAPSFVNVVLFALSACLWWSTALGPWLVTCAVALALWIRMAIQFLFVDLGGKDFFKGLTSEEVFTRKRHFYVYPFFRPADKLECFRLGALAVANFLLVQLASLLLYSLVLNLMSDKRTRYITCDGSGPADDDHVCYDWPMIFIYISVLKLMLEEFCQLVGAVKPKSLDTSVSSGRRLSFDDYASLENVFDQIKIIINMFGIFILDANHDFTFDGEQYFDFDRVVGHMESEENQWQSEWKNAPGKKAFFGAWCAMRWMQALYSFRAFPTVGPRIHAILSSVTDPIARAMYFVMAFVFFASVHAFFCLGTRDDDAGPSPLYSALVTVYRLVFLGDFDISELSGQGTDDNPQMPGGSFSVDPTSMSVSISTAGAAQMWFAVVSLVGCVVLMNLLIAVLGSSYDKSEERSQALFLQARASIISDLATTPWYYVFFDFQFDFWAGKRVWFVKSRNSAMTEDEASLRTAMQRQSENQLNAIREEMGKQNKAIREEMQKLHEQQEQLLKEVLNQLKREPTAEQDAQESLYRRVLRMLPGM